MASFLVYVWSGKYIQSVMSTEDLGLIELMREILPAHGYRVTVRQAGKEIGPEHK